jgi:hypothetical protein
MGRRKPMAEIVPGVVRFDGVDSPFAIDDTFGFEVKDLSPEQKKNLDALQKGWNAYRGGEWEKLEAVLHDGIVWHELNSEAAAKDYKGVEEVMEHFRLCKTRYYSDVKGRKYHMMGEDHAVVSDVLVSAEHEGDHDCLDVYRLEYRKIVEMWTCVTHPTHANVTFLSNGTV